MKRLLFLALMLAVMPLFAGDVNFIYYDYDYHGDYGYDEYWYDGYYYDGYWVYMPYGYYCGYFPWWYPWWWDWFWWRCHWCHHFSWDFYYSGFYVVWYDHGHWWYRPRYGRRVRYRLPYSYATLRVKSRTHGIYLPEKPPREISVPYREEQVRALVRQQDPDLFSRVEREHSSGNLEQMRMQHVAKVNREIAEKNREHGIKGKDIDINQLTKRTSPVQSTESKSSGRIEKSTKQRTTDVSVEPASKGTSARIKKVSKNETGKRDESPVRSKEPQVRSSERVTNTDKRKETAPEPRVEENRDRGRPTTKTSERENSKSNQPEKQERKSTSRAPKQSERKYSGPQGQEPDRTYAPRSKR